MSCIRLFSHATALGAYIIGSGLFQGIREVVRVTAVVVLIVWIRQVHVEVIGMAFPVCVISSIEACLFARIYCLHFSRLFQNRNQLLRRLFVISWVSCGRRE